VARTMTGTYIDMDQEKKKAKEGERVMRND
jgi:hypothetical protein